jgi:hypothetical protein
MYKQCKGFHVYRKRKIQLINAICNVYVYTKSNFEKLHKINTFNPEMRSVSYMIQIFNGRELAFFKITEYKNDMILLFSGTLNMMVAFFSFHDAFLRDPEHIEK